MSNEDSRNIILGVSGGIAAYKSVFLARMLVQRGYKVRTVMTAHATEFIKPLTFSAITGNRTLVEQFDCATEYSMEHIALADWGDILVIAPATANIIGKMAAGIADDLLSTTALAVDVPIIIAPSMNTRMYLKDVVQENLHRLRGRRVEIIEPGSGELACGMEGKGRMAEPARIMEVIEVLLYPKKDLTGQRIIITAGATREYLDPFRFISNPASGKMGFALAEAAIARGAEVILIAGHTEIDPPTTAQFERISSSEQMLNAIKKHYEHSNGVIMAAAVCDFKPLTISQHKIKKSSASKSFQLEYTSDILAILGKDKGSRVLVGFAAESQDLIENAIKKMQQKNLDFIVANDITRSDSGFRVDTNRAIIIRRNGSMQELPTLSKRQLAHHILDEYVAVRS